MVRFAIPTANTSGIPAILHDNEAVIPLSRGRKIPVEMGGVQSGGGGVVIGDIISHVTIEEGPEGESGAEQAARVGEAIRDSIEAMVEKKMADQMAYGGALNPRGI